MDVEKSDIETGAENSVIGKIIFSEEEIANKAKELGKQISNDFQGEELILIGTLKGAVMWMSELMKNISLRTQIDFMIASSYGSSTETSGYVTIKMDAQINLYNKNVMVVEDIIDTGTTLEYILTKLKERHPKSLTVCTMLDKPSRRTNGLRADYAGFTVDDLFIVGYGLDYDQRYRNLPYISFLNNID